MTTSPPPPAVAPPAPAPQVTPVPAAERAVAPDVARGLALLGIAIANAVGHLWGVATGPGGRPVDGSTLDRIVDGVVALFVDRRTMPMFALLYGYGIGVVVRRRAAAWVPWPACRADLLRRAGWLVAFGVAHIVLLWEGDILATYGLTGLLAVAFVRVPGRVLAVVAVVTLLLSGLLNGALESLSLLSGGEAAGLEGAETSPWVALLVRLAALLVAPLGVLVALPLVLAGLWAARRSVLERPAEHLPLLRRWALGGLAVSVVGGLPMALAVARVWEPSPAQLFWPGTLHMVSGAFGGVAFAALVAWVVAARGTTLTTLGPVGRALRAVGTRSLSCYLLQSVLFVVPLAAWTLGLGQHLSSAQVVAWAVGVWLVTVAFAVVLERSGRRGPVEAVYRRLVYRSPAPAPAR
ncbi:DUF418 domain-containing protein [Cellulomonas shaoxiangyii]|uniref:DUF418 domain-containing protein n=1 Tax=Cellulomonas shaoxiangyii TaxID=2566013 RepID=A0A4P7SJM5_9CELL|nr:DUF418 domain-containing protein [Cellulomonas shaoxiangyii]QCB94031.1 DUF418 domain-containing protein [Cellulomonas shaoxiangyii]TGY85780.1 DUF418 domain-containing protein [Cellulomonas shaoxiangyii]